jgi:hypothetical protein
MEIRGMFTSLIQALEDSAVRGISRLAKPPTGITTLKFSGLKLELLINIFIVQNKNKKVPKIGG